MFGFGSRDTVGFTRADGTMVAFNASVRRRRKTDRPASAYNLFVQKHIGRYLEQGKSNAEAMRLVAQLWNRRGAYKDAVSVGQAGWQGDRSEVGGVPWGKAQRKKSASKSKTSKSKTSKSKTSKSKTSKSKTSKSTAKSSKAKSSKAKTTQSTGVKKSRPRRAATSGTGKATRKASGKASGKAKGTRKAGGTKAKGARKSK